jgi:cob(I)alamin adenosyltransferase
LAESMKAETKTFIEKMKNDLEEIENELFQITIGEPELA